MLLDVFAQAAEEKCGLTQDRPVLVGVSGGADSLALLHALNALGYPLIIAHLDHGIRADSAQDAAFVAGLAQTLGLTFVGEKVNIHQYANEMSQSLEEAAREVRYRFLFEQARAHSAQAVAVGHHADDQVETVLMHFLRGAALPGLSGMAYRRIMPAWDDTIPLVRPMLNIWRADIDAYVHEVGWQPRLDWTNEDTTYFRNRLRHDLIPTLVEYNPQIRKVLLRMADVLGEEDRYLDALADDAWDEIFLSDSPGCVELKRSAFLKSPKALARRVLRRAVCKLRPDLRDVGYDAVQRGLAFVSEPPESSEIDLAARLNLAVVGDVLIVKTWGAALPDWGKPLLPSENFEALLSFQQSVALRHGWRIEARRISPVPANFMAKVARTKPNEAWLDEGRLDVPLVVRARQEGETWQPLGMAGQHQSLQDFFINAKVPAHLRDIWPLVCYEGQVVWAVGLRPSEAFKVTIATQRLLHLKLSKMVAGDD